MMKFVFGILCFLFVVNSDAKNKITYLKLERTPCFGKCPTYSVEFLKTGQVIYTGKKNTKMLGDLQGKNEQSSIECFFSPI
jgi:hypothetical protein